MKTTLKRIQKIYNYFLAKYRYKIYYKSHYLFLRLLRSHITEQFECRLASTKEECYSAGQCQRCGCQMPSLQFSNLPCEGGCYPAMIDKKTWIAFMKGTIPFYKEKYGAKWILEDKKSCHGTRRFKKL